MKEVKPVKAVLLFVAIWLLIPWSIAQGIKNFELSYEYDLVITNELIMLVSSLVFISFNGHWIEHGFRISSRYIFRIILFAFLLQGITIISLAILIIYSVPLPDFFPSEPLIVVFLKYVVLVPVCEEVFLRGLIQPSFGMTHYASIRKIRISYSVLATAGMFALMHIFPLDKTSVKDFLSTLGLGVIAGYYRDKTGSIFSAFIAHATYNFFGGFIAKVLYILTQ